MRIDSLISRPILHWLPFASFSVTISILSALGQEHATGGILEGVVMVANTRRHLPGVNVKLQGGGVLKQSLVSSFTSPDGRFRFEHLRPGRYTLEITAGGFDPQRLSGLHIRGDSTITLALQLSPQNRALACDTCSVPPLLLLSIKDAFSGSPLAEVGLKLNNGDYPATSDNNGLFTLTELDPGAHRITLLHKEYHAQTIRVTLESGSILHRDILLQPLKTPEELNGRIMGSVTDSENMPLEQASIRVLGREYATHSDTTGQFRLPLLEPGSYTLIVSLGGYVSRIATIVDLQAGEQRLFEVRLETADTGKVPGGITGTVSTAAGAPLAEVEVLLAETGAQTTSDSTGTFRFGQLTAGVYSVSASADGFTKATATDVDVWEGEVAALRLVLRPAATVEEPVDGQGGSISGLVVDAVKGTPLTGAAVRIEDSRDGAVSDLQGRFLLAGLRTGRYTLRTSHSGYQENVRKDVIVTAETGATVDLLLLPSDVQEMQRMVVRASAVQNTGAALLKERQTAFTVTDGLSSEEISRAGAGNVAAAMKQVPGVTILDGKYVVIRGLSERYILTTLNGMILPSPDPDKRAVPLDMFPTALLDNIVTNKSFTADQPGNFSGGNINIVTRAIPEKLTLAASISGKFDKLVFSDKSTLEYQGGKLDWLGMDDGGRALPVFLDTLSTDIPHYTQGRKVDQNAEAAIIIDQASEAFDDDGFVPTLSRRNPDFGGGLVLANRFPLGRQTLGALVSLTYSSSTTSYTDNINSRYRYAQVVSLGDYDALDTVRAYTEDRTTRDILWGGLGALTWEPNDHQRVNVIYMQVRSGEDDIRHAQSTNFLNLDEGRVAETYSILFSERNLGMLQMHGKHDLPLRLHIQWQLASATTEQDQPNQRTMMLHRLLEPDEEGSYDYRTHENILPVKNPERTYRKLNESSFQTGADLTFYPFGHDEQRTFLRLGWSHLTRKRKYRVRRFFYEANQVSMNNDGGPVEYFNRDNLGIIDTSVRRGNEEFVYGLLLYEDDVESVNYNAARAIPAWYLMGGISPWEWLDISAGIRNENASLDLGNFKGDTVSRSYEDWLPGAGLTISPMPEIKVRAVYGKTLAQPTERELAPYGNFDPAENVAFVGNPELEQTTIHNADLRLEWFQHHSDLLAVSLFFKKILRPIEKVVVGTNGAIQYLNFDDDATVFGIEFEGRYSFERLSSRLQGLSVGGNAALIRSRLTISDSEYRVRQDYDKNARRTRELQGQSPWVVNGYIAYDNAGINGYRAALNFHLMGPTIMAVTQGDAPDAYSVPYPIVGLSLGRKLPHGFSIEASVNNLFGDRKKVINEFAGKEFVFIETFKERRFGLKIGYTF